MWKGKKKKPLSKALESGMAQGHAALAIEITSESGNHHPVSSQSKLNLDINEIKELYLSGMGLEKLALRFGVSHGTINNRLKEAGVPLRQRSLHFPRTNKSAI